VVNTCRAAEGKPAMDLANLHREGLIKYNPFPDVLKGKYQHFTQADTGALLKTGYDQPFLTVEQGVTSYVTQLLKSA
jgi:ADP-L-glycero-D-manno-heptose 6-epimerase